MLFLAFTPSLPFPAWLTSAPATSSGKPSLMPQGRSRRITAPPMPFRQPTPPPLGPTSQQPVDLSGPCAASLGARQSGPAPGTGTEASVELKKHTWPGRQ
ncbi:unnamed protein product [Rangifer tarandus platyrhynchus]|uniref:Uncharacterized protein n=1 Tax=Rangifer tarandus platyrhynchus TaxID=3082113 RepID=A0ABN8YBS8_RANTA|nr:unnamed protein product [Rangifer tarandus platyrhynchus]